MEREHPRRFQAMLKKIAEKIPGIHKIDTERTNDGRLLLRFNDKGFQEPFYAQQVSDGTLKVFAYLLLLEDPSPPPFLCIEEPENGLYHKLLEDPSQRIPRTRQWTQRQLASFCHDASAILRRCVRAARSLDSGKRRRRLFDDSPGKRRSYREQHGRGGIAVG